MNIRRKGLSVAFSATLLSSLLATVAATAVSGAVTIPTGVGNVPRGGTSANTLVINFTENSAACIPAGGGTVTYTINDANGGDVTFSGTPTVVGPGSLGTTASVAGNVLTLTFAGSDVANVEQVTVSGLAISATATAAPGPIVAALGGTVGGCFTGAAAAAGLLSSAAGIGATTVIVAVSNLACPFVVTGTPLVGVSPAVTAGSLVLGSETRTITAASAVAPDGTQTLTLGAALGVAHPANDPATQSGACLGAPSPGTVANALTQTVTGPVPQVLPGENNQPVANIVLSEAPSGTSTTFVNGQVVTFTITSPASGVVFSTSPTLTGPGGTTTCALSFDRRSCTATIAGATAGDDTYTLGETGATPGFTPILVDVDPTVPLGTPVRIVASIPSVAINATAANTLVANVGRVVVGVAAQPTILIGVNDQQSGMITLTESGAGFFRAGVGSNNTFGLCLATGETFTRAPWAVVTNAGGTGANSLQLRSGLVGASQVQGTLYNDGRCAYWTIFTASTTGGGVIEIRGSADGTTPLPSGANNGPRLSVPAGLAPGSTQARILIGQQADVLANNDAALTSLVSNAIRAFRSGPIVAATSQPVCPRGSTDCLAGNITITEQFNGQLKAGQVITLRILPRATVQRQDVILKTGVTNDLPIVTTNSASGLLVSPVSVTCPPSALLGITLCTATFVVTQQSFGPTLGQITVSNIHYVVAADAVEGPVLVNVSAPGAGAGGPANAASIDAVVSNARIGTPGTGAGATRTSILNGTLPGVVKVNEGRTFTATTKVVRRGNYVTWQADMDPAMAGERVEVWIARKSNAAGATYGAFTRFSTRAVNSQGLAVFHYDNADQPGWVSVRFRFAGNAQHGPAMSLARQARYL